MYFELVVHKNIQDATYIRDEHAAERDQVACLLGGLEGGVALEPASMDEWSRLPYISQEVIRLEQCKTKTVSK